MSVETNKAIARRWNEDLFNVIAAVDVAEEFVSPDFLDHSGPPWQPPGLAGAKWIAQVFRQAFPDLHSKVDDIVAEGDRVVVRWSGGGTHEGELFGIPPTGKEIRAAGIHIFRIANGKIVEHWGNSDDLGMMQQLGVIPGPAAAA